MSSISRYSIVVLLFALLVAVLAPTGQTDTSTATSPLDHQIFLPSLYSDWCSCYEAGNKACNPGAECDECCWRFTYPHSGNVMCDCNGWDCPHPVSGDCIFRYGDWHDDYETGESTGVYLVPGPTYRLSLRQKVWTEELPLSPEMDTLDAYLAGPSGYHLHLFTLSNVAGGELWDEWWAEFTVTEPGYYKLLFVCITDAKKDLYGGRTNFYLDAIAIREAGSCQECVQCQLGTNPVETFCQHGAGADCGGCCPGGDDCAGLDPQCPTLPPPHFYRELGRTTTCYGAGEQIHAIDTPLNPPQRPRP